MTLPKCHGARHAHAVLLTLVALALCPALATPAAPASEHDERNMAALVASRDRAAAAYRPGGQFTQAVTKKGVPALLFKDGLPDFWGSCGGTIAINTSSMTPGELKVVRGAAADFAAIASGPWTLTTTTATAGSGSVVVVVLDATIANKGDWGLTHFTKSFGMTAATPRFFMDISDATVHISDQIAGAQNAPLLRAVTLHELGHVAGADHNTSDPRAIMAPAMEQGRPGYSRYTAAEAAGIRAGGSHACS